MGLLHCCLLFSIFIQSCPPFVASQYVKDMVLGGRKLHYRFRSLSPALYSFTVDLYEKILESNKDGNIFFSPTSIYLALATIYAGSEGETKKELRSALKLFYFNSDDQRFYEDISRLHQRLDKANKKYTLQMANRLFGQQGLPFKDDYLEKTKEYLGAELEALDFKSNSSASRSKINSWVEKVTSGKIKDLFPEGAITRDTVLALANAAYFKGSWLYQFDEKQTKLETFYASMNQKVQVPMMHRAVPKGILYTESIDKAFRLLELPYNDDDVTMLIALEGNENGFNVLFREKIDADASYYDYVREFKNVMVQLSLPTFNLQQTLNLKKTIQTLGLENLFGNANLSGIADSVPLKLSGAYHKAFFSVKEFGTEAAAATGFGISSESAAFSEKEIIRFVVDRPFVFFVVEKTTGSVLFLGHIKNPLNSN